MMKLILLSKKDNYIRLLLDIKSESGKCTLHSWFSLMDFLTLLLHRCAVLLYKANDHDKVYFGATTLFNIAIMHICECSAKICLAEFRSLYSEFLDINRWARGSKSCCITWAITDIALDASLVI